METNLVQWGAIVVALISGITGTKAWDFYASRAVARDNLKEQENTDKNLYRDDLKKEVDRLRTEVRGQQEKRDSQLDALQKKREKENDSFRTEITRLQSENSSLRTQVSFLQEKIEELTVRINDLSPQTKGRKAISESVMKWIFRTRSALTNTYQAQAMQEGRSKADGEIRRNSDPKWLAVEQYRLRKDPSMLFSAYQQGLFPALQPLIPDLLYLHPEYEDILTGDRQVSFGPTTSSTDTGSGTSQSGSSGYGQEDHGSNFARLLLLGALGAGVYYVYKK